MKVFQKINFISSNGLKILLTYLYPQGISKTLKINDVILSYNHFDRGGRHYLSAGSWKETTNKLYDFIEEEIQPKKVIDIGANYGFLTCVFSKRFPSANIIAVEPVNFLNKYILNNIKQNNVNNVKVIKAICGEKVKENSVFSVNPVYSQDSRVKKGAFYWKKENVQQTALDEILKGTTSEEGVFIKVDTQGFEPEVIKGGEEFFRKSTNWLVKMEYSPFHLNKQGFNEKVFLKELINEYEVYESPEDIAFKVSELKEVLSKKVTNEDLDSFVEYVKNKNSNELGWIDLLITPKRN